MTNDGFTEVGTSPKLEAAPGIDAEKLGIGAGRVAPEHTRCRMARIIAALDQRNAELAEVELAALTPEESVLNLTKALKGAARFLAEPVDNRPLDLTSIAPIVIQGKPPTTPAANIKLPPFVIEAGRIAKGNDPTKESENPVRLPMVRGQKSPTGRVPETYGRSSPERSFMVDQTSFAVYAGRYLVSIEQGKIRHVLDARALAQTSEGFLTIHHAAYHEGRLIIATSAPSEGGTTRVGLVTAVDPSSGTVVWQSQARACTTNFEIVRGRIVCAYGPPGVNDKAVPRLFVLRADNGVREADFSLPSTPSALDVADTVIRVRGFNDVTTFAFK